MSQSALPAHIETLLEVYLRQNIQLGISIDPKQLAYRWVGSLLENPKQGGKLEPINANLFLSLDDLKGIDTQKDILVKNTRQFLAGIPANHVLMTGTGGSGKSSLMRALLREFHEFGLRVIEVAQDDLFALDRIRNAINDLPTESGCRYIIYCDDIIINEKDEKYHQLKSILDGALDSEQDTLLLYATSNGQHETIDQTISLSDRFGIWLTFPPMEQRIYLEVAQHYIESYNIEWDTDIMDDSLTFATKRGEQSGRVAYQFSRQHAGGIKLNEQQELKRLEKEALQVSNQENKLIKLLLPHLDKIASHTNDKGQFNDKEVFLIIFGIVVVLGVIIMLFAS